MLLRGEADLVDHPVGRAGVVLAAKGDVADGLVADVPVDQLGADQHLARPGLERVEVDVPAAQPGAVAVELGDTVRVHEDPPPLAAGDESDDARRNRRFRALAGATGDGDDVLDSPDRCSTCVEQRQPHHPECVDQLTGHARRLPTAPGPNVRIVHDPCYLRGQTPDVTPSAVECFDLDERVAVGDATAPLGEGVVGEAVGDLAVGVVAAPPAERDGRRHRGAAVR